MAPSWSYFADCLSKLAAVISHRLTHIVDLMGRVAEIVFDVAPPERRRDWDESIDMVL